jgi:hypothetical protein
MRTIREHAMQVPEGTTDEKECVVVCKEIDERFKEYFIKTEHKEIEKLVEMMMAKDRNEQYRIFASSYKMLTKYDDKTLDGHYTNDTQQWRNWCDDVVIFYSVRLVLLKKLVPIVPMP